MHTDDNNQEDDVLELDTEAGEQDDTPDGDEQQDDDDSGDDGADETLIGFDDEEPIAADPENSVVRRLRDQLESEKKRRKEAEAKVPKIEVGKEPELEDFGYDEPKWKEAWRQWEARRIEVEAQSKVAEASHDSGREEFGAELAEYAQQKTKLARPDFDVAETVVTGRLNEVQQSVLVMASKNKAALIYALGKSPARLDALAEITNPIKLAVAINDMERSLKVQARKKAPEPEGRMKGGTPKNESGDKKLERLEKEAERTGDRTAINRYKRSLKEKANG